MTEVNTFETTPSELDEPRSVSMQAQMESEGVKAFTSTPVDYFAFDESETVYLDGGQWVQFKVMNEGARVKYQKAASRDVKLQKGTGDAIMRADQSADRGPLLKASITGWNLISGGQPVPFTPKNLDRMLETFPPPVIDKIEKAIRKANPWLQGDVTVEDIDAEIESLHELRARIVAEEEGKAASGAK